MAICLLQAQKRMHSVGIASGLAVEWEGNAWGCHHFDMSTGIGMSWKTTLRGSARRGVVSQLHRPRRNP